MKWMMDNIMSRDQQMKEMTVMNQEYNKQATFEFLKTSQQAARVYKEKKDARNRQHSNFQSHLMSTLNQCEWKAKNSIDTSRDH